MRRYDPDDLPMFEAWIEGLPSSASRVVMNGSVCVNDMFEVHSGNTTREQNINSDHAAVVATFTFADSNDDNNNNNNNSSSVRISSNVDHPAGNNNNISTANRSTRKNTATIDPREVSKRLAATSWRVVGVT